MVMQHVYISILPLETISGDFAVLIPTYSDVVASHLFW